MTISAYLISIWWTQLSKSFQFQYIYLDKKKHSSFPVHWATRMTTQLAFTNSMSARTVRFGGLRSHSSWHRSVCVCSWYINPPVPVSQQTNLSIPPFQSATLAQTNCPVESIDVLFQLMDASGSSLRKRASEKHGKTVSSTPAAMREAAAGPMQQGRRSKRAPHHNIR